MAACCAYGCTSRPSKKIQGITFHRFPVEKERKALWVKAIRRKDWSPTQYTKICSLHFEEHFFDRSMTRVILKKNATPSIFPQFPLYYQNNMPKKCCVPFCRGNYTNGPKVSMYSFPKNKDVLQKWLYSIQRKDFYPSKNSGNMPCSCCIPYCKGNYSNGPKVSSYSFPKNKSVLQKWLHAIQRQNFHPSKYSRVCELHFRESDFLTETSAYDVKKKQTISVPLLVKRIKPTAVPSVFPNYPSCNLSAIEQLIKGSENEKEENEMNDLLQGTDTNVVSIENCTESYQMTSFYYDQLDVASKEKYLDKLTFNGTVLPDPLDSELRLQLFKPRHFKISPDITFGDIYMFLVETENVFSRDDFKNYKNLDCYKIILRGKVQDILAYKCDDSKMCVLTCDIQDNEIITKLYRPWTVISCDGVIQSGHCSCMDGLGSICLHVSALLLSLEIAVRKDITNHSRTENSEEILPEKSTCIPISGDSGKDILSSSFIPSPPTIPSRNTYRKFLKEVKKIVPNAAIFSIVSDSEFSDSDEGDPDESSNDAVSDMQEITILNHIN